MSFYDGLERYDENIAICAEAAKPLKYAELRRLSDNIVSPIGNTKALVFLLCRNGMECVAAYLGCLRLGHVPLLLDAGINTQLLNNLMDAYRPNYIWAPKEYGGCGREATAQGDYLLRELHTQQYEIDPELALLMTTSGSTGSPKLVRLSYRNLSANAAAIADYLELTETERPITTLPMNYVYGLSIINSHLLAGAAILLTERTVLHKEFWQFFRDQGATSFGGVPYTYEMLKKLRFFHMELPTLRAMTQAGGKLSYELTKEFAAYAQQKGIRFFVMYGQAEATARMGYLPYALALEKCGSMGRAIPGGSFRLEDESGNEICEAEKTGELVYEGPNVSLGYAESLGDLAKGDENRGVLHTGDMAYRDTDGYYYIAGRKKRFVKLFGNRVSLDDVEQMVQSKGYACACIGADDHLNVVLTDKGAAAEVEAFLSVLLHVHKSAVKAAYLPEIPKNEAGKTAYARLEEMLHER